MLDRPDISPAHVAQWSSTWVPCAVERDALRSQGSNLSWSASAYQRIISNNSYTHDLRSRSHALESQKFGHFQRLSPFPLQWGLANEHGFLN